jgi:hypothetical protein
MPTKRRPKERIVAIPDRRTVAAPLERTVRQAMSSTSSANTTPAVGSLDGDGSADHDLPYRFGSRPCASAPYPFNTRQYARLLVLRGRVRDHIGASLEMLPVEDRRRDLRPAA